MDVVGSEIGQKMRSAIKAKLTELGCYVDDELPDYVMVMVANKRTQLQMEDDLQLFLGDNTELFVDWLHQVLKKLQEVTVAVPLKMDKDKAKERSVSKERKSKDKKEKDKTKKTDVFKKSKKKDKEKFHHKKEKKVQKNKKDKKSKSHERIRPNIPPLLMNIEKDSEPSITDVFAGQILKNHGVNLDVVTDDAKIVEIKPNIKDKRPILPVIDPASILEPESNSMESSELPKDSQLKEINYIEAKIQGLKQKLVQQLDSLSDDEDFLTIRTEAEELMNDFAEDVLQEISEPTDAAPILNDPSQKPKRTQNPEPPENAGEIPERPTELPVDASGQDTQEVKKQVPGEALPQIELKLPKRPVRERLGGRGAGGAGGGGQVASVVRVRPRPRAAPSSSLLLRAVADAHKSLLAAPPPPPPPRPALQRALVLPMRRRKPDLVPARTATSTQDSLVIETINIHNTTVDKDKDTQFIVTMDGYHPNAFLAKKLMTEGLLDDEAASETLKTPEAPKETQNVARDVGDGNKAPDADEEMNRDCKAKEAPISSAISPKKRLSDTSEDSDTQVIIKKEHAKGDRRQGSDASGAKETQPPAAKKRRASPIVFDVDKKESRDAARPKAASAKYDSVPPLWGARCRAFPSCRFGASCVFGHPRCRFAASCTRRGCLYAHDAHKPALPSPCKFYPKCANAACPFLHPKPCRFGKACANRLQCGFFHADDPANAYPL